MPPLHGRKGWAVGEQRTENPGETFWRFYLLLGGAADGGWVPRSWMGFLPHLEPVLTCCGLEPASSGRKGP